MSGISKRTYLREVNPHLICLLCRGYLIDATTVVECLHSFCRSCILKHLRKDAQCPSCKHLLNTAKPNIKADKALQDIVYKLVPGLYHKEMRKRREFYSKHPEHGFAARLNHLGGADSATPEQRGEDVSGRLIFAPEDAISLSLEYLPVGADPLTLLSNNNSDMEQSQTSSLINPKQKFNGNMANRRYLQCPALVTIAHLKKFLGLKYSVDMTRYNIDICHRRAPLPEHWTLMDVAYIFAWKRNAPIRFFYRITQEEQRLEAPPNDRPSTPGLGASQPLTNEQANEQQPVQKDQEQGHKSETPKKTTEQKAIQIRPQGTPAKSGDSIKKQETLGKQSTPNAKENAKNAENSDGPSNKKLSSSAVKALSKSEDTVKQVKSPIKILKNSDGRYQVLRGPSAPAKNAVTPDDREASTGTSKNSPSTPLTTPAEFSVVSIGDSPNSNGVKITLKQCPPGSNNSNGANSKKPKVISNVLLRNSTEKASVADHTQDLQKQDKQKRKVTFMDVDSAAAKQAKKPTDQADKKQFLHGFRLTAKQAAAAGGQQRQEPKPEPHPADVDANSVEAQVRNILKSSSASRHLYNRQLASSKEEAAKKRPPDVKATSTNIAERAAETKQLINGDKSAPEVPVTSSSNEQQKQQPLVPQPIDVYAFPNDPPTVVPAGAVKRKCPPGLPICEMRKKHQQYQGGKRGGLSSGRGGGAAVKCYRNQSVKPMIYAKSPGTPRPLQSLPNSTGNATNANAGNSPANASVTSTSPKNQSPSPLISNDTRNLLDGCGLNIPASLSITLTAPKSPSRGGGVDSSAEHRGAKDSSHHQNNLDKMNPSITLNDKSVDPRVLKALKAGQMRMPMGSVKGKGRQANNAEQQQGTPVKRKKEDNSSMQQPRNILDLSGAKKMDLHPLRIPTPLGKFKVKTPNWSQANSPKSTGMEDPANYMANGQVVTLNGGQMFYRAPPGSLTPAVHRIGDIPTPTSTRAPVYAPSCFSTSVSNSRPTPPNLSLAFPSLQSLYALSQAPSLEQFHMDSRLRIAAAAAVASKDVTSNSTANSTTSGNNSNNTSSPSGGQIGKSHIAAQCAPVKPARSSCSSFAVPIAKQLPGIAPKVSGSAINSSSAKASTTTSTTSESEPSASSTDSTTAVATPSPSPPAAAASSSSSSSATAAGTPGTPAANATEQKNTKSENSKEAPTKIDFEQSENCASSTEEGGSSSSQQGAASPRVTSTASPSPPPPSATEDAGGSVDKPSVAASSSKSEARQPSPGSEVTSSNNKSPESPDSSSGVTENVVGGNLVDSTKPAMEKSRDPSPVKDSSDSSSKPANDEHATSDKLNGKIDGINFKKPMTSEALQKRFLAAFPSNEWANNPIAAEQFGNFLKSLSSMQAEAQSKNAKAAVE